MNHRPIVRQAAVVLLALLTAACAVPGTIPQSGHLPPPPEAVSSKPEAVVRLPRDEAPHEYLMEWWYYTGHVDATEPGHEEYGFEFVVFQVMRGRLPPVYISHFAITDATRGRFQFAERTEPPGPLAPSLRPNGGFNLSLGDWSMSGYNGRDVLTATMPGYALKVTLNAVKPAVLHGGTGLIDYGDPGFSYYYSRTRMTVDGTLTVDGVARNVSGLAWMDHQWGNFITLLGGGWDWFSIQLDDGQEYMIYEIRDQLTGQVHSRLATRIDTTGTSVEIPERAVGVAVLSRWQSPHTGATYPGSWRVTLPEEGLTLQLQPTLADQELRTTASTGNTYWEGAVRVTGERLGQPVNGRGYVELTGYGPKR